MNIYHEDGAVLLVDKPLEWTSFDVVNKIRRTAKIKKIGHAGTLDPLATGLLILCIGRKTKTIESIQAQEKTYTGTILLGKTTASYDLETPFNAEFPLDALTEDKIRRAAKQFLGEVDQFPPLFSAIKVNGERAYQAAREGRSLELKARKITIYSFDILDFSQFPYIHFEVKCSKGTYIRSLANDLGKALGNGACLTALRRTKIGHYDVNDAKDVASWVEEIQKQRESLS